ncbi:MAG: MinD/ParA family protein [Planctomycetota bacterium]|nr:MAG: MinD/ParA family protein [Planctomycetota bacterium]
MTSVLCATAERVGGLPRDRAPFLLVAGGKGGVGKSLVCANLALALARRGRRVLLADLDLGLGNQHVLFGSSPERSLEHALLEDRPLEHAIQRVAERVDLLAAGTGEPGMVGLAPALRAALERGLERLRGSYDVVIGDAAAGIGVDVLWPAAQASRVLIVTTPEPAALTDAYGLIKALDAHGARASVEIPTPEVLVNLVSGPDEAERVARGLRLVSERFLARSPRLAGWLPRSSEAARSVFARQPFVARDPHSLAARCIDVLAGHVERSCPLEPLKLRARSAE